MNHFHACTAPLAEVTWRTNTKSFDYETAGSNLGEFFSWLGSLSPTAWLLIAAAIGLTCFYYWCLGPFPRCYDTEYNDCYYDDYDTFE